MTSDWQATAEQYALQNVGLVAQLNGNAATVTSLREQIEALETQVHEAGKLLTECQNELATAQSREYTHNQVRENNARLVAQCDKQAKELDLASLRNTALEQRITDLNSQLKEFKDCDKDKITCHYHSTLLLVQAQTATSQDYPTLTKVR